MLGLTSSASSRLAGLLLEWCCSGRQTNRGTQIHCDLTHQEIGECLGTSRETVTRSLNDFKNHNLIELHGAIITIPNCDALASYAGIGAMPDPFSPAA
jgi:CRP/FNR family transcriptional regulator